MRPWGNLAGPHLRIGEIGPGEIVWAPPFAVGSPLMLYCVDEQTSLYEKLAIVRRLRGCSGMDLNYRREKGRTAGEIIPNDDNIRFASSSSHTDRLPCRSERFAVSA